ncbi:polysaccharide lyase family 1 protein, partial [Bacteroidota bacterium]
MKRIRIYYRLNLVFVFILIGLSNPHYIWSQTPAFPGAEGFGAYSQGGRGGDVYTVSNLNDSGTGSLRFGIESASGPRTIVFAVSGLIKLQSNLNVNKDYMTIAGQTAPGDGICLRDASLTISADHVIVRYIRSRLGDESLRESDAISINSGHNIIMDHCSASWSVDECFSCSTGDANKIDNVTVQWSIISEALRNSIHSKGAHSYGALIRGCYGARYTYHHNLFAHNVSRNPRPGNYDENTYLLDPEGLQFDFRNNVMYNWGGSRPGYDADIESVCRYNYVGNYGKPGPNSNSTGHAYKAGSIHFRAYYSGNHFFGSTPLDQWSLVSFGSGFTQSDIEVYKQTVPFSTGPIFTESALEAFDNVMAHAGASHVRDAVDTRVMNEVKNGTGKIIDDEDEVGSWPVYNTYGVKSDTDLDGMPDNWETENGLNPDDASDRNGDRNHDGYTNLEEYLYSLVPVYSNLKPMVNLVSPVSDTGYLQADTVFVKAVTNNFGNGNLESLELFLDTERISGFSTLEIDTFLTGISTGPHLIYVKASYNQGNFVLDSSKIYIGTSLYNITIDSISGKGSVILDPPGGTYVETMEVSLSAMASFPYKFGSWTGDVTGTDNPIMLTINSDISLAAGFLIDSSSVLNINFQPVSSEVPPDYIPDFGYEYSTRENSHAYGWIGGDNFETRERNGADDLRLATLNHMQKSGDVVWEIALADGHYVVNVHMGDADYTDAINSIDLEGIVKTDPQDGNFDD